MTIDFSKDFDKQFVKLSKGAQKRARTAIALFASDMFALRLRNHPLKGEWRGHRSISAGGDLRLHYKEIKGGVIFAAVGSHSQLYK